MKYLKDLDNLIETKNPIVQEYLNDGLASADIISYFNSKEVFIIEGDALHSLYKWHNGTRENTGHCLSICLFPNYYLMSLENIETCIQMDSFFYFKAQKTIPIFKSCEGDFLAIKVQEFNNTSIKPSVYFCSPRVVTASNMIRIYDSIDAMIQCVLECYKNNVYFLNMDDGLLDEDTYELYKIARKLNPLSEYWNTDLVV